MVYNDYYLFNRIEFQLVTIHNMDQERVDDINLMVGTEAGGVQIHVRAYPIFCVTCNNYFPSLYHSNGSRYGYLGALYCNCGERIHLSDSDYYVDYVNCYTSRNNATVDKSVKLDFKEKFRLRKKDFEILKQKFQFDIYERYTHKEIYLSKLIEEIEKENNLKLLPIESEFPLPEVVKEWLAVLKHHS